MTVHPSETTLSHTRLLRLGLAEEESREYWSHADRPMDPEQRVKVAFEERWFGSRAMARVRYLILNLAYRFDAFPSALKALNRWKESQPEDRRILCHWHLQLSDPLYRSFTGGHLVERLHHPQPTLDRNSVLRWVEQQTERRWASTTTQRMVASLMGCLNEVGFCKGISPLRPLALPRVSDRALGYILYLLRETDYEGELGRNPYLGSLGLHGADLEERLSRVPGIQFHKMSDVMDLQWDYPSLWDWAQSEL